MPGFTSPFFIPDLLGPPPPPINNLFFVGMNDKQKTGNPISIFDDFDIVNNRVRHKLVDHCVDHLQVERLIELFDSLTQLLIYRKK